MLFLLLIALPRVPAPAPRCSPIFINKIAEFFGLPHTNILILQLLFLLLVALPRVPAPAPRCSPIFIINKIAEFSNLMSDLNPYFPVPPCEYGGPLRALLAGVSLHANSWAQN
jgi:hypothetical protein